MMLDDMSVISILTLIQEQLHGCWVQETWSIINQHAFLSGVMQAPQLQYTGTCYMSKRGELSGTKVSPSHEAY